MKLLIDAGNTRIKWALVNGDSWLRSGILPVGQASELLELFGDAQEIQQIWASNVAGTEVAQHIRELVAERSIQLHFAVARERQCGVRNGYASAAQLGSDRWAAMVAAWHLVQGQCLVVNCGTAFTIDALSGQGEFLGGLIVPGLDLMQRSLAGATAQLKSGQVETWQGKYAQFPQNTADAMFSGALQAGCGAIQRQHALLGDAEAPVVLSGGSSEVLREHLRHVTGEASRLREEVQCGHSRTRGLRPTVSWPHLNLPLRVVDNLVLQGLLLISREANGR